MPPKDKRKNSNKWIQKHDDQGAFRVRFGRTPSLVHAPSDFAATVEDRNLPKADLQKAAAHGYNGECVGALHWVNDDKFVFPISGLCITQSIEPQVPNQSFFRGHNETVTCLAVHTPPGSRTDLHGVICASGQVAPSVGRPFVSVWRPIDNVFLASLVFHERKVCAVGFSPSGEVIFSVGDDDNHMLAVWMNFMPPVSEGFDAIAQIQKLPTVFRDPMFAVGTGKVPAYVMSVMPSNDPETTRFALYDGGVGNLGAVFKFYTLLCQATSPPVIEAKAQAGVFGEYPKPSRVVFCSWTSDERTLVCGNNGYFYVFSGNSPSLAIQVSKVSIGFALEIPNRGGYMVGSVDGMLYFGSANLPEKGQDTRSWLQRSHIRDCGGKLVASTAKLKFNTASAHFSQTTRRSYVLIGTKDHHLLLFDPAQRRLERVIQVGHDGEIWAMCPHPKHPLCATGCSEGVVRFWNLADRQPVVGRVLDYSEKGATKAYWPTPQKGELTKGFDKGIYAMAFNKNGELLAIGHGEGTVRIITFPELQPKFERCCCKPDERERICDIKFNAATTVMAAASWDQSVYLFKIEQGRDFVVTPISRACKGNTAAVTHMQFSKDGVLLMTNAKDGQILYFDATDGSRFKAQAAFKDTAWDTPWTCVCGWPVCGIWAANKDHDLTDINAVCSCIIDEGGVTGRGLLAAGDDNNQVKLYRYPAMHEETQYREYSGHSSHVTIVRFHPVVRIERSEGIPFKHMDLMTAGGSDHLVLQWDCRELRDEPKMPLQMLPWNDHEPWKKSSTDANPPEPRIKVPDLPEEDDETKERKRRAGVRSSRSRPWATEWDKLPPGRPPPTAEERQANQERAALRASSQTPHHVAARPPWALIEDLPPTGRRSHASQRQVKHPWERNEASQGPGRRPPSAPPGGRSGYESGSRRPSR